MNYFRVEYSYGKTGTGGEGFETEEISIEKVKSIAIKLMRDNWEKISSRRYILHTPTCPLPTIRVVQISEHNNRKIKDGLDFTTKWR